MSIFSEIEKVTEENFLIVLFDAILLVSPGLLTIFYFHKDTFLVLDSLKLILLSITTTLPFVFWNIILLSLLIFKGKIMDTNDKQITFKLLTISLYITNFIFYAILFISYLFKLYFKTSLFFIIVLEAILTVVVLILNKNIKNKINKTDSQPIDYIPTS